MTFWLHSRFLETKIDILRKNPFHLPMLRCHRAHEKHEQNFRGSSNLTVMEEMQKKKLKMSILCFQIQIFVMLWVELQQGRGRPQAAVCSDGDINRTSFPPTPSMVLKSVIA